jgi:hypothetical protein
MNTGHKNPIKDWSLEPLQKRQKGKAKRCIAPRNQKRKR